MPQLSIDRFEDNIAILVIKDGRQIEFPKDLLPKDAKEGEILSMSLRRNIKATQTLRKIQEGLKSRDPGGDIRL